METITQLAPIVLFVYNRPEHTLKTLEALSRNSLASRSQLYIYADGPKEDADDRILQNIAEVRRIIKSQQWCGSVSIRESDSNHGLGPSIKSGVTEILEQFGKVVVLEDDLITSKEFLSYMNNALDFYDKYPAVFSIGGYTYPKSKMVIPADYPFDTYVCLRNCSWGWATWKDRWEKIDWDVSAYGFIKEYPECKAALNRMGDDEFSLLFNHKEKGLNIWSIQFTIAHFVNHAVAIMPCESYVNNLGLDGSGENCSSQPSLTHRELNQKSEPKFVDILYEDRRIINAFYNVNCKERRPLYQRIINCFFRKAGRPVPFVIKKKIIA